MYLELATSNYICCARILGDCTPRECIQYRRDRRHTIHTKLKPGIGNKSDNSLSMPIAPTHIIRLSLYREFSKNTCRS